jgi:hypothetical protein
MNLSEAGVKNTMEAGLGVIWGEDPRYSRDAGAPFKNRLAHVIEMAILARNRDGDLIAGLCSLHCDSQQQRAREHLAARE